MESQWSDLDVIKIKIFVPKLYNHIKKQIVLIPVYQFWAKMTLHVNYGALLSTRFQKSVKNIFLLDLKTQNKTQAVAVSNC